MVRTKLRVEQAVEHSCRAEIACGCFLHRDSVHDSQEELRRCEELILGGSILQGQEEVHKHRRLEADLMS